MTKLKIAFVGVGGMGQMAHLSNYAVLGDECEVVALAEPRPRWARQVADRYGVPVVYENHEQLLNGAKVDAIVAAQHYRNHAALIPDILRAGVPVFTEKPLCLTVEAGRELARISEETGTLHMVGYHKRSDPAMERAKGIIDEWKASGQFGKLRYIRMQMPPGDWVSGADMPLATDEAYPPMISEQGPARYNDKQTKALDIFVNFYIHQVNAIRHFLGENYKLTFTDRAGILLIGESDSGVTVSLEMAASTNTIEWRESIEANFEHGFVKVDLPAPLVRQQAGKLTVYKDGPAMEGRPEVVSPILPNVSAMRNQARNFLAAVRGDRPAPCASREALEDLILAEAYIDYRIRHYSE